MAFALTIDLPAEQLDRPAIVEPAPREASFGRVSGRVSPGTDRVVVLVNGAELGEAAPRDGRFVLRVDLPPGEIRVEVAAEDAVGNRTRASVGPVLGLPDVESASSTSVDPPLARDVDRLVERFGGVSGVYVQDLASGRGAAWNARGRFTAASTVKAAIAVEVLRILAERPPPGSALDELLRAMLIDSDNESANELLRWIGGSETQGAAEVNETLAALELTDSRLYGGFLTAAAGTPIPLEDAESPPVVGKYTTAWDLARLFRAVHEAARGRGPLLELDGAFTSSDARALLWILADSTDRGKIDRFAPRHAVVPHKGGWVTEARHDAGLVYTRRGALVVAVMTWVPGLAGPSSDILAGRVTEAALDRLHEGREPRRARLATLALRL